MQKQLYLDLIDRLKTIADESGAPAIQHFDLWNRSVEFIEEERIFPFPAVFFEFGEFAWRTQGGGRQDATVTLTLHILAKAEAPTADGDLQQADGLAYLGHF